MDELKTVKNAINSIKIWPPDPKSVWMPRRHWARTTIEFYLHAKTMRFLMEQKMGENLDQLFDNTDSREQEITDREFRSCNLAFYNFATVALNATKELAENAVRSTNSDLNAAKLFNYRKEHQKEARAIIEIRNKVIAHPEDINKATTLSSWGSSCKINAKAKKMTFELSDVRKYILDPKKDLPWLHKYINNLFPLLDNCFGIDK